MRACIVSLNSYSVTFLLLVSSWLTHVQSALTRWRYLFYFKFNFSQKFLEITIFGLGYFWLYPSSTYIRKLLLPRRRCPTIERGIIKTMKSYFAMVVFNNIWYLILRLNSYFSSKMRFEGTYWIMISFHCIPAVSKLFSSFSQNLSL